MRTLSLARPLIMMVVGLPGAGKSFFAKQFCETFGTACVSIDRIRYELFAQPKYATDENEIVTRIADYMIAELANTGRSFVIDGNCNSRRARQQIEQLAKHKGYKTLVIWVQTDLATAKHRATKRNKNTDEPYSQDVTETQFEALSRPFDTPNRESSVVISGKHAYSTQVRTVLKKLATPHVESLAQNNGQKARQVATVSRIESPKAHKPRRNVVIR